MYISGKVIIITNQATNKKMKTFLTLTSYAITAYILGALVLLYAVAMGLVASNSQDIFSQSVRFVLSFIF